MLPPFISDIKDKHPTFILASHGAECYRHSFPTLMTNTRHLFLASYGAECYRHSFQTFRPNFLSRYAPDCTILSPKMQKLPTVGGGPPPSHTLPPSVASLPRAWSLRSLAISRVPFSDFQMLASMHILHNVPNRLFSCDVLLSSNMVASIATEVKIHSCKHLFYINVRNGFSMNFSIRSSSA